MQILIQVISTSKESLRQAITNDKKLKDFNFKVSEHKRLHRDNGWAKIHSTYQDTRGAINLHWDSNTGILLCRVVNRGAAKPNLIIGDFIHSFTICSKDIAARFRRSISCQDDQLIRSKEEASRNDRHIYCPCYKTKT